MPTHLLEPDINQINAQPWTLRARVGREQWLQDNPGKSAMDWVLGHLGLDQAELDLLDQIIDARTEGCLLEVGLGDHFVVRHLGNKARVCRLDNSGDLTQMSFHEFRNAYIDKFKEVGHDKDGNPKMKPLGEWFLKYPGTPRYSRVEYAPGIRLGDDIFNLWRGWPEGLERERDRLARELPECSLDDGPNDKLDDMDRLPPECMGFLDHLHDNICGGDTEAWHWLLGWIADSLINPGPGHVALVMRGPMGSGKTILGKMLAEFFAPHTLTLNSENHLVGRFNRHLLGKSLVLAEEAFFAGNHTQAAALKTLVTDNEIFVEPKGVDGWMAEKQFRLIIASNDEHVVRAARDDRRFLVMEVDSGDHNRDTAYFADLWHEWRQGGRAALFRWLTGRGWREYIANEWNGRTRPETAALARQQDLSLEGAEEVVHAMLATGEPRCEHVLGGPKDPGALFLPTRMLLDVARLGPREETTLGRLLAVLAGGERSVRKVIGGTQYRGYWLPDLATARSRWETHLGRTVEWPENITDWGDEQGEVREEPF